MREHTGLKRGQMAEPRNRRTENPDQDGIKPGGSK
jgi:hypothetical protein